MRSGTLTLGWRGVVAALLLVGCWFTAAGAKTCKEQLLGIVGPNQASLADWIDAETADAECTKALCTNTAFSACDPAAGAVAKENLVLVFSDEFNKEGRSFKAGDKDPRWTAQDMYYFPTHDEEVYKPEQVTTADGAAVITIDKKIGKGNSQQPDGTVWNVAKAFVSGFMEGWNKFCYTGGYLEARVKLPGDHFHTGFWPALWTMGNLGRAGYMESTQGMWPYSYSECGDGSDGQAWSKNAPQLISACPDALGFNRSRYGMAPGVGRGAPEFDVFEVSVHNGNDGTPSAPGPNYQPPMASHTLQMAPLLPQGVHWLDESFYQSQGVENGVFYPGKPTPFQTFLNSWWGSLSTPGQPPRPGNEYQDSISAVSYLDPSFWTSYHTFGVDWKPGEYLRWYIDGTFVYEVNKYALLARTNATGASVGARQIPVEAVYIIFNLGMSKDFTGTVDFDNLEFPSSMFVDYIRVYQSASAINVGCSPAAYPTAQYIACNRDKYHATSGDDVMITEACTSGAGRGFSGGGLAAAVLGAGAAALLALLL